MVLIDMHNCSLDDKIRISLGCCSFLSLFVCLRICDSHRHLLPMICAYRGSGGGAGRGGGGEQEERQEQQQQWRGGQKGQAPTHCLFPLHVSNKHSFPSLGFHSHGRRRRCMICLICRSDFRKEYKAEHPDNKSVSAVAKEGGERWKSMSDEDKKPYLDKAAELKAEYHNGERSDVCSFFLSLCLPSGPPSVFYWTNN